MRGRIFEFVRTKDILSAMAAHLSTESRPTKSKTDDQRQIGDLSRQIWPAHPLHRQIWYHSFTKPEQLALCGNRKLQRVAIQPDLEAAIASSVLNGWKVMTNNMMSVCAERKIKISTNQILCVAADGGNIRAMRTAVRMGADSFNSALVWASQKGQIGAMREAVRMGATEFNNALQWAATRGQIDAMHEAHRMGPAISI